MNGFRLSSSPTRRELLAVAGGIAVAGKSSAESGQIGPPAAFGPVPSKRQLAWHRMEYYAFVHFNMNTFTGKEWGEGYEDPKQFNPTALDCNQWAQTFKAGGMKGVIITAKHHDGFCLWPSKYTDHSVRNSPFRGGKGDVLRELSDACRTHGLKFGVYLSPWDRNHPDYGKGDVYNRYFANQLTEALTQYGPIFEVWFDGANGEGPNGRKQTYDFPLFIATVRKHQPNAVIFSDAGPDIRWVGNEQGRAAPTNWCLLKRDDLYPGTPRWRELTEGHRDGTHWVPAECDVSIRPGWFYRQSEDSKVKTVEQLVELHYQSVGQNASFLLNVPADRHGLIHGVDAERLAGLRMRLDADFKTNLARGSAARATNVRGRDQRFDAGRATDGRWDTYWATDDDVKQASLEAILGSPAAVNRLVLQEHIPLGQRIERFEVQARIGGAWTRVAEGTTVGYKRIMRFPTVTADRIRVDILDARACPTLSNLEIYHAPESVAALPGKPGDYHGFARYDFGVDGCDAAVVAPKENAPGTPWIWRAEFFDHRPEADLALLSRGFHLVYIQVGNTFGCPSAMKHWDAFYAELTGKYGFGKKAALEGLSRGGLYCYNWAAAHPDRVACIYGDAPVCDFKSWPAGKGKSKGSPQDWAKLQKDYGFVSEAEALAYKGNPVDSLAALAKARIPLIHVFGDADDLVPWEENTGVIKTRYEKMGGSITLIRKPGVGHHPHGLDDPTPVVEFIVKHCGGVQ